MTPTSRTSETSTPIIRHEDYVAYRMKTMPPLIKEGDILPNEELSIKLNETNQTETFWVHDRFKKGHTGVTVIFTFPGARTPICKNHLIAVSKAAAAFQQSDINIQCLVPDNRDVALDWAVAYGIAPQIMIPDYGQNLTHSLGIGMDKCVPRNLGFVPQRGRIVVQATEFGPVVVDVSVEKDSGSCTLASHPEGFLKTMLPTLQKIHGIVARAKESFEKKKTEEKKEEKTSKTETAKEKTRKAPEDFASSDFANLKPTKIAYEGTGPALQNIALGTQAEFVIDGITVRRQWQTKVVEYRNEGEWAYCGTFWHKNDATKV